MNSTYIKLAIALSCLSLGACGMKTVRKGASEPAPEVQATHEPEITLKSAEGRPPNPDNEPLPEAVVADARSVAPAQKIVVPTKKTAETHAKHEASKGVDPEKSLRWLKNGNKRYLKGFLRKDGQGKQDIIRLSKGQAPHAIVLSCSDSRVPPELVFDQKLGELFVVRTAGEALDDNVIGSIEYAVEHLGSRLIVVMGHTSCGAVKAAISTIDGKDAGSPALNGLVNDLHPRLQEVLAEGTPPASDVARESWANARGVAKDLAKRSSILREKLDSGAISIRPALYHLDSGEVKFE